MKMDMLDYSRVCYCGCTVNPSHLFNSLLRRKLTTLALKGIPFKVTELEPYRALVEEPEQRWYIDLRRMRESCILSTDSMWFCSTDCVKLFEFEGGKFVRDPAVCLCGGEIYHIDLLENLITRERINGYEPLVWRYHAALLENEDGDEKVIRTPTYHQQHIGDGILVCGNQCLSLLINEVVKTLNIPNHSIMDWWYERDYWELTLKNGEYHNRWTLLRAGLLDKVLSSV